MRSFANLVVVGLSAFFLSALLIGFFKHLAFRYRWLDRAGADPLKIHKQATPFVGGFGIVWTVLIFAFGIAYFESLPIVWFAALWVMALAMHLLGLCDDKLHLSPSFRLILEMLAGAGLGVVGMNTGWAKESWIGEYGSAGLAIVFAFVTIYGPTVINSMNMFDGMDGLAGGVALISAAGCLVISLTRADPLLSLVSTTLAGALIGFLVYNFHPASVFMGDNGSYFLGFVLAILSLAIGLRPPLSIFHALGMLFLLGLPLIDAGQVIVRRIARGESPFKGDRNHIYDVLHRKGFAFRRIAGVCYLLQCLLVGIGVGLLLA